MNLSEVVLPDFELPRDVPRIPASTYQARLAATYAAMKDRGLDALIVYGDREHFANTSYLTGFDPRYEESLIILVPGEIPTVLAGNENVTYARSTPYEVDVVLFSKLSLVGQPDPEDLTFAEVLGRTPLADPSVRRVGLAGWKYWVGRGVENWSEVPQFIFSEVSAFADTVENATDLFVHPDYGLRIENDVDQIAFFEFSASHASTSVRRLLNGIRVGMTELEASSLLRPIMLPFSYHPTMLGGYEHTGWGVASPGGRELQLGDPVAAGLGYWGSNTARAGFLVSSADELPTGAVDYVERLVAPYFDTMAAWYETIRIGLSAGELYDVTASRIGAPFFGVFLNPGHFIHLDEWPASPVQRDSTTVFRSGNALQLDIIPGTGGAYHTVQGEDGIVLADAELRSALQGQYPAAWRRIQQRRAMLSEVFGIDVHDDVLPMSNTAGYLPPYWLASNLAMTRV